MAAASLPPSTNLSSWAYGEPSLEIYVVDSGEHIATVHVPPDAWKDQLSRARAYACMIAALPDVIRAAKRVISQGLNPGVCPTQHLPMHKRKGCAWCDLIAAIEEAERRL